MTEVILQQLTKTFDDVTAVDDISTTIPNGQFAVIVGPSGCGKSTTLRLIAGLESPTSGTISFGNRDVTTVEPAARNVAMVFQNYALYPHMSARRNITFGLSSTTSFSDTEIEQRVTEAAETLDITALLERKPAALSGGERQRVALGRALVREPEVFLLDEPLSNLDAKLRIRMRAELAKLHEQFQTTTIYVTHDQTEAMTLGDVVVVMNDGHIEQTAPPQQLYDLPATRFVAEFIGDPAMNIVTVKLTSDTRTPNHVAANNYAAAHQLFTVPLTETEEINTYSDNSIQLGIRPEDISLVDNPSSDAVTFDATVTVIEPLGDRLLLECQVDDDQLKAYAEPRTDVKPGDAVTLHCNSDRIHLFDPMTGQAVYHAIEHSASAQNTYSDSQYVPESTPVTETD